LYKTVKALSAIDEHEAVLLLHSRDVSCIWCFPSMKTVTLMWACLNMSFPRAVCCHSHSSLAVHTAARRMMLRIDHLIALARTASNLSAWCADTTHDYFRLCTAGCGPEARAPREQRRL